MSSVEEGGRNGVVNRIVPVPAIGSLVPLAMTTERGVSRGVIGEAPEELEQEVEKKSGRPVR